MPDTHELLRSGMLRIALLPPENPCQLDFERYTIPLLEHDYPARTPSLWNHAYRTFGLDIGNVAMTADPNSLPIILDTFRSDPRYLGGGAGVGIKQRALALVDQLDPCAAAIGALNLIRKTEAGLLHGYNTDGEGYADSLAKLHEISGASILILGAGGTSAAIAFALAARGARITIVNRTTYATIVGEDSIPALAPHADVIINTTTKGSAGPLEQYSALAPAILPATNENVARNAFEAERVLKTIRSHTILSDVVIAPRPTPFLRSARQAGFTTLDGIPMVVNQAAAAFWILHRAELKGQVTSADVASIMQAL